MHLRSAITFVVTALTLVASQASADIVYDTGSPTGFFTPFNSSTVAGKKFGDSGYLSGGSGLPTPIAQVQLGLATFSNVPTPAGTADLVFTFNDGDPSGSVFGPGTTLFSTTVTGVTLPENDGFTPRYFDVVIPTPGVVTSGGFNNVGWSVGVQNFSFGGSFGFQNKGNFNNVGFMTGNASEFTPGTGWSLFSFGPGFPSDSANFVATLYTPEPTSLTAIASLGLLARRRR